MSAGRPGAAPLRVGVNLLWLVPGVVGGSEEYTVRSLLGLADLEATDLELELFALEDLRAAHPELVSRFPTTTLSLSGRAKPLRVAAETTWLPAQVRRRGLDLVHHPGGVVPLVTGAPSVLTIHDLQPLDQPRNFSPVKVAYLRAVLPRSVRQAEVIVTPSATSGRRVVERLHADPAKIRTVWHGVGDDMGTSVRDEDIARVAERRGLRGRRWILYPVITYPHKDHATLIAAFARLAVDHPDVDLVLPGGEGPAESSVRRAIERTGVAERIHRLGRVPREDLDALLAGAAVVAFPSRYEGFGAGALEAMAHGAPLVAADATALPEVVGDAGLLVAPGDVGGWAAALGSVLRDADRARRLGAAGRARATRFSRGASGAALADAYRAAAGRQEASADSGDRGGAR